MRGYFIQQKVMALESHVCLTLCFVGRDYDVTLGILPFILTLKGIFLLGEYWQSTACSIKLDRPLYQKSVHPQKKKTLFKFTGIRKVALKISMCTN